MDKHNQPYAEVIGSATSSEWTIDARHETYVVEACDPCEADKYAYAIQGIEVSDFLTPHFYDPVETPGTRYSFTGAIKAPRQILAGGYISWVNHRPTKCSNCSGWIPAARRRLRIWGQFLRA